MPQRGLPLQVQRGTCGPPELSLSRTLEMGETKKTENDVSQLFRIDRAPLAL